MPLQGMRQQLRYWKQEREAAERAGDVPRVERCERFIGQCEKAIDALEKSHLPRAPRPPKPDDFFH